ncbi:MAG TPA: hypothetical protein DDY73_13835 [Coprobacter fastidiosus]|jgi:hypothetical protein|uniref:Hcp1 family type VI secretion system effector n=1 Tax=Coprobacter fastidiosus TaxID=1099853 RepID=A0A354M6D5_9BACT|nr:hypothetical protein [Coprobacter fastidiosus]HBJ10074.1 hypothetical protein [Coprobacter fastidiosus]
MKIRKNGKAYDGGNVEVTALGNIWEHVTELSYGTTQEHQLNHTISSNRAASWSMGKVEHTASITILVAGIAPIEKAAGGDLLSIKPFDINVTYVDEYNEVINDTITAKFSSQGRSVTTEMGLAYQYDLFVLDINYQSQKV